MRFHHFLRYILRQSGITVLLLAWCALPVLQASAFGSSQSEETGTKSKKQTHKELITVKHGAFSASSATRRAATGNEKAFAKFSELLCTHPDDTCRAAIQLLLDRAAQRKTTYAQVLHLAEQYFYNSPKSQAIYRIFLQHAAASSLLSDLEKEPPRYRLAQMELNSVGSEISDFQFATRSGDTLSLHRIKGKKANALLLIDPHCRRCQQLVNSLSGNPLIKDAIAGQWLNVVAVNVDQDLPMWNMIKDYLPASWTVGYDITGLQGSDLYDLHLMPSVFLYGADRRILLQNPDEATLLNALRSLQPRN